MIIFESAGLCLTWSYNNHHPGQSRNLQFFFFFFSEENYFSCTSRLFCMQNWLEGIPITLKVESAKLKWSLRKNVLYTCQKTWSNYTVHISVQRESPELERNFSLIPWSSLSCHALRYAKNLHCTIPWWHLCNRNESSSGRLAGSSPTLGACYDKCQRYIALR